METPSRRVRRDGRAAEQMVKNWGFIFWFPPSNFFSRNLVQFGAIYLGEARSQSRVIYVENLLIFRSLMLFGPSDHFPALLAVLEALIELLADT